VQEVDLSQGGEKVLDVVYFLKNRSLLVLAEAFLETP
jgi:hypothetical protein